MARRAAELFLKKGWYPNLPLPATPTFDPKKVRAAQLRKDREQNLKDCDVALTVYCDGPVEQVREHNRSWWVLRKRIGINASLFVCQRHRDCLALGQNYPGMQLFVVDDQCIDDCIAQLVSAL